MPTNRFDQACRYLAKLDPVGLLCWLLREMAEELRFRTWLDARTLPFPGDPERICDTVAWLGDADPACEWAMPVEFCLKPIGELFGRLLIYLGQLWGEKRPTDAGGERFEVGAVVVNLTGRGRTSRDTTLRRTGMRTALQVVERNLADEDASAVLAEIAAGRLRLCLLPWIPLMLGGREAAIIQQWGVGRPGDGLAAVVGLRWPGPGVCRGGRLPQRVEGSLERMECRGIAASPGMDRGGPSRGRDQG